MAIGIEAERPRARIEPTKPQAGMETEGWRAAIKPEKNSKRISRPEKSRASIEAEGREAGIEVEKSQAGLKPKMASDNKPNNHLNRDGNRKVAGGYRTRKKLRASIEPKKCKRVWKVLRKIARLRLRAMQLARTPQQLGRPKSETFPPPLFCPPLAMIR